MRYIRIILTLLLILVFSAGLTLFFSDKIIEKILKDGNTKFKNINYIMKNGEIEFSNFYLKGKDLGKGRAKLDFKGMKLSLSNMKLDEIKEDVIFGENIQIDGYIRGLKNQDAVKDIRKKELSTENYIAENFEELKKLKKDIYDFINNDKKSDLEKLNKLKIEYLGTKELKRKLEKFNEIRSLSDSLVKEIVEKRKNISKGSNDIIEKNNILMTNLNTDLMNLENRILLNNPENLDNYIFIDNGEKLIDFQNKGLKILELVRTIKGINFQIENLDIGNGKIIIENLESNEINLSIKGYFDGKIKKDNAKYTLTYDFENLSILTEYGINDIFSVISYDKENLLEGKIIKLISEIRFSSNNFVKNSRTVLSIKEKEELSSKMKKVEENNYLHLIDTYMENLKTLEMISEEFLVELDRLDKLEKYIRNLRIVTERGEDEVR